MVSTNGHSNNGEGVRGADALLEQPGDRKRESLAMIQRAVKHGWAIKDEWLAEVPQEARRIMMSAKDERTRLRAAELLQVILRDAAGAAIALDKIERLDEGRTTDEIGVRGGIRVVIE